ncbi:toxin-antitoxin system TumE family protein [Pseudomonas sivasensis]|uniref:toxin-antitoxin system TumE family protein n=1 Tax=Pseudomonas sivasensis TaxID=1880678 RepID=UPI003D0312B9
MTSKKYNFFNIDSSLSPLRSDEISGSLIDTRASSWAYNEAVLEHEKRLNFVLEFTTSTPSYWLKLIDTATTRFWIKSTNTAILVYDANTDCGYTRTYRTNFISRKTVKTEHPWIDLKNEDTFYNTLNTPSHEAIFNHWLIHMKHIMSLPIEFATGRLANTSTAKVFIILKGSGCVICGNYASCFAATTMGTASSAVLVKMPLCSSHINAAKKHPSVLNFLASIFNLNWDWPEYVKLNHIPDNLISTIHSLAAKALDGDMFKTFKHKKGWVLTIRLSSGWTWKLRLNTFLDYAYVLLDTNNKQVYRADSAMHHPEVKFPPHHEHSSPLKKNKDHVSASFLYGHPLFDMKRLKDIGNIHGAYAS